MDLLCIFCSQEKKDGEYWYLEKSKGVCRCNDCLSIGISETQDEKNKSSRSVFVPAHNLDLFKKEYLGRFSKNKENFAIVKFAPEGSLVEMSPRFPFTETCTVDSFDREVDLVQNSYTFHVDRKRPVSSERGEVSGFSTRSRSRLNKKIAMLKKHHIPLFVTLTYHVDYPDNFKEYKTHLHNFYKRLTRRFPNCGSMWKMEFQKRGAVHFHLFLWGVSLEDAREFVPTAWNEIAGYGSSLHLQWHKGELGDGNNHCVQQIRSWNGVTSYASKYFAKLDEGVRGGRVWGVRGAVPFSSLISFRVDMDTALEFRYFHALEKKYQFKRLGFWTNDYHPKWLSFLDCLLSQPSCPDDPPDWDIQELLVEQVII